MSHAIGFSYCTVAGHKSRALRKPKMPLRLVPLNSPAWTNGEHESNRRTMRESVMVIEVVMTISDGGPGDTRNHWNATGVRVLELRALA